MDHKLFEVEEMVVGELKCLNDNKRKDVQAIIGRKKDRSLIEIEEMVVGDLNGNENKR